MPPTNMPVIDAFISAVKHDLGVLKSTPGDFGFSHPNLTKSELMALHELSHDKNITIKPADKGGAVVVMDTSMHLKEINRQLSDYTTYKQINYDPKFEISREIKNIIEEALTGGIIDDDLAQYLVIVQPRTPVLYVLPKIHKSLTDPPGRPIVSGSDSIFCHIAIFLDKVLRVYALEAESFIRDTSDFLCKLRNGTLPSDTCITLVSFDVTSLYTVIDHTKGALVVQNFLKTSDYTSECPKFVLQLLNVILRHNYFLFCDNFFYQIQGTAMGSNMAPTYANMYMRFIEETLIYTFSHFLHVFTWWRYIDDVFLLWTGNLTELQDFYTYINEIDETVKFTMVYSDTKIQFLDVLITLEGQNFITELYTKPTDCNNLLEFHSNHPRKMVRSLPISQLMRVKRIVSDTETSQRSIDTMINKFKTRGYPRRLLKEHRQKIQHVERDTLLTQQTPKNRQERIQFISTYSDESGQIADIIRRHWPMLGNCLQNIPKFTNPPLFSYCRPTNLRDTLVKADLGPQRVSRQTFLKQLKLGCFPCLKCVNCRLINKGPTLVHPTTNKSYDIRHFLCSPVSL
ncbi:uncharacterized protein LOC142652871 isoform X2 [Rhinoderma darwinii]